MKKYIGLVLVALSGCILTVNAQQSFSYKNPLLPTEVRVNGLLDQMTLDRSDSSFAFVGCVRWTGLESREVG
jgi:hypothetical protein